VELFLGMDVGGSRSRATVVDGSGRLRGAAEGPGGNPVSHLPDQAFRALAGALRAVLHDLPAGAVRAAVLGMAGVGPMRLPCRPAVDDDDVIVAFVAGTAEPAASWS
jgi:glucosamine kinase